MTTIPTLPEDEPRRVRLLWCALEIADIQLRLLALAGVGHMADDSGLIHGASDAKPDPHWRVDASLKGAKHEHETLSAKEIRARSFGKQICQQHAWINVDHCGRCMHCGEPLKDSDPELPPA